MKAETNFLLNTKCAGYIWHSVLALLICLLSVQCKDGGGEDIDDDEPDNPSSKLVQKLRSGVWSVGDTEYSWSVDNEPWFDSDKHIARLYFFGNGRGVSLESTYNHSFLDESYSKSYYLNWFNYTETSGKSIRVRFNSGETQNLILNGNHLDDTDGGDGYAFSNYNKNDQKFIAQWGPASGSCGDGVKWAYEPWNGELVLNGSGRMADWSSASEQPWRQFRGIGAINIKGKVTHIGNHAFEGLATLGMIIDNGRNVESYGDRCFAECVGLNDALPLSKVSHIGTEAFADCRSLKVSVHTNDLAKLADIGDKAFDGIKSMSLNNVVFGSALETIGCGAFGKNSESTVSFDEGVRRISSTGNAPDYATFEIKNSELTLPNSLESLGVMSFAGSISKLTLGSGLKTVGEAAIITDSKNGDVYISAIVPPACPDDFIVDDNTWSSVHSRWTLHVPKGSEAAYRAASGWNKFKIEGDSGSGSDDTEKEFISSLSIEAKIFSAHLSGEFNPATYSNYSSIEVRYGKSYGLSDYSKVYINEQNFSIELKGLTPDCEYYYMIVGTDKNKHKTMTETKSFTTAPSRAPENCTYTLDGKTFKMVKVTGLNTGDFFIMQTELPPSSTFKTEGHTARKLDVNADNVVLASELMGLLHDLRNATGIAFRLPTSAEWKHAAKGGQNSNAYKYSGSNSLDDVGWYKGNSANMAHAPAQLAPNELGLYDMSGNYGEVINDTEILHYADGNVYGGYYKSSGNQCSAKSHIEQPTGGTIEGSSIREANAFNAKYYTVRLVYSAR